MDPQKNFQSMKNIQKTQTQFIQAANLLEKFAVKDTLNHMAWMLQL